MLVQSSNACPLPLTMRERLSSSRMPLFLGRAWAAAQLRVRPHGRKRPSLPVFRRVAGGLQQRYENPHPCRPSSNRYFFSPTRRSSRSRRSRERFGPCPSQPVFELALEPIHRRSQVREHLQGARSRCDTRGTGWHVHPAFLEPEDRAGRGSFQRDAVGKRRAGSQESAKIGAVRLVLVAALLPVVSGFMGNDSGLPSAGEQRVPVDKVLNGLEVHALEPGETAIEAFILLKVLDQDGDVAWSYRTTNRLSREELLGALTVQVDVLRKSLRDEWDDS